MYKYSVLTYNIGGYEVVHPIKDKNPEIEYVLVTDDRSIKSDDWTVVYVDNPYPEDPFWLVFDIRYNPFRFVHTDVVMKVDGSMGINGDLMPLFDKFIEGGYDCAVMNHPTRMNMYDEYIAWLRVRGYEKRQAERALTFMNVLNYEVKEDLGLLQYNWMIQRKEKKNLDWNEMTLAFVKYLAPEGKMVDRLDQTIGTFVLNHFFEHMNVMCVDQSIATSGVYFNWYKHKSNIKMFDGGHYCKPFLFGKPVIPILV